MKTTITLLISLIFGISTFSQSNPCSGNSISYTSSVSGGNVTLNATHPGYSSSQVSWYNNGTFVANGSSTSLTLAPGTYTICSEATSVVFDSSLFSTDTCFNRFCDTITVSSSTSPCSGNSISYTSSVSGGNVTLNATHPGYSSSQVSWYNNGTFVANGSSTSLTLSPGTYTICAEATSVVFDSSLFSTDTCFNRFCDTITVSSSTSPCSGNSISYTSSVSGGNVTLNATHPGYSSSQVSWYNNGTFVANGSSTSLTLSPGTYTICAEATSVVFDSSLFANDTCYNSYCDSITIRSTLSTTEYISELSLSLYPNPANDYLKIKITAVRKFHKIRKKVSVSLCL